MTTDNMIIVGTVTGVFIGKHVQTCNDEIMMEGPLAINLQVDKRSGKGGMFLSPLPIPCESIVFHNYIWSALTDYLEPEFRKSIVKEYEVFTVQKRSGITLVKQ